MASEPVPPPRVVAEPEANNLPATVENDHTSSVSHASFLAAVSETIPPVSSKDHYDRLHVNPLAQQEDAYSISNILDQLPPREVSEDLVDLFFTFLETNWYYFDKKRFRAIFTELYADRPSTQQLRYANVCHVLLVLALASTFKHLVEPFHFMDVDRDIPGAKLFANATRLIPRVIADNSVESVICSLLASLYLLSTDDIEHHHIYLALALNQALGLSMHREAGNSEETPQAREVKVRVFWTIYTMERLISGIMGLPTMLQVKDISVSLPQKRQDLDGDDCQAVDRLIAITKLTMGMDEIVTEVPIDKSESTYKWALFKMESLRPSVPIDISKSPGPLFRANAHLQIIYLMIWVNVSRGATLRLVRQTLHPSSVTMALGDQEAYLRSQRLVEKCREAATIIINWITQLHHRGLLAKYSFTDFHTCSSATIVLLLHSLLYPTSDSLPITQGINALKFMAEGSRLAMNALRLIERLQEAIQKSSSVEISGSTMNQPSLSGMVVDLDLSQIQPLGTAGNLPLASTSNFESSISPTNQTLFPDLEPWLLEYSDQDLMLFGFDGFGSVFNADVS
ncbi:C6 transcription factor [Fusarium pseudoanthophilum]|uniref:C6 transcription factor n=1 Tax=Fusarium pseudoanthophilum TaxID=48495 RepID=A0A8H5KIQ9_9HYPO|nr:C6 transcription factor [Fusarium pseudoanthophilum]